MSQISIAAGRERIAPILLAAMLSAKDECVPSEGGLSLAEIACDYAELLTAELNRRDKAEKLASGDW